MSQKRSRSSSPEEPEAKRSTQSVTKYIPDKENMKYEIKFLEIFNNSFFSYFHEIREEDRDEILGDCGQISFQIDPIHPKFEPDWCDHCLYTYEKRYFFLVRVGQGVPLNIAGKHPHFPFRNAVILRREATHFILCETCVRENLARCKQCDADTVSELITSYHVRSNLDEEE